MDLNRKPRTSIKSAVLKAVVVSPIIPTLVSLLSVINPAWAGDGASPFVVTGDSASPAEHTLPKLSTAKEYYVRGLSEGNAKDYTSAIRDYTEALHLNPQYGEALGNRGAAKFNLNDYAGALSDYNAALRIFPGNKPLIGLKDQVEGVMKANANQEAQNQANRQNILRNQAMMGGDFADPSTIIMMNAQRRGLVPAGSGDLSDPASIIMMNARRRGLIPAGQ